MKDLKADVFKIYRKLIDCKGDVKMYRKLITLKGEGTN